MRYLWQHGIDLEQDAVVEAAIVHWKKTTGAIVNQHTMLKIIVMKYAEDIAGTKKIAENSREQVAPLRSGVGENKGKQRKSGLKLGQRGEGSVVLGGF